MEARVAVEMALGTAPWLMLAGLVEGYVSPSGIGVGPAVVIGFGLGALYCGLVWSRGRPPAEEPSPPEPFRAGPATSS